MASRRQHSRNPRSSFSLLMFEEDVINICSLVSKVPHQETGGNLFGLWTSEGNGVVLVATGPGKNCTRSVASFYQDIPYMARVGQVLTQQYPLCHIGEWHSHHHLQLYEPSSGDCHTIRSNYPTGSQGFVLMIANFTLDGRIQLSPYKFTDDVSPFQVGKIEVFKTKNPFNDVPMISSQINIGREEKEPQQERFSSYSSRERDRAQRACPRYDSNQSRSRSRSPQKKQTDRQSKKFTGRNECPPITLQVLNHFPQPPSGSKTKKPNAVRESRVINPQLTPTEELIRNGANKRNDNESDRMLVEDHSILAEKSPNKDGTAAPGDYQSREKTSGTSSTHNAQRRYKVSHIRSTPSSDICLSANQQQRGRTSPERYVIPVTCNTQHITTTQDLHNTGNRNAPERSTSGGQLLYMESYKNGIIDTYNASHRSTNQPIDATMNRYALGSERSPEPSYQYYSPMSSTTPQWYDVDKEVLQETLTFMETLSHDNQVKINKDKATHELSFHFTHHYTLWTIYFPRMFPREGYVECSDVHSGKTKKIKLTGGFNDFKHKLKNVIYR